ncbi:MAG: radical SAM protein [Candidatus Eisenbacteria bacterium]|nr:radical SAM protein [Candidatus Eisenbacteria bacterium]
MKINEIFHSIQGESTHAGRPCVFVRTTGCSLRCVWCDTKYAFYEGRERSLDEIIAEVRSYGCPLIELTGGDPLEAPEAPELCRRLLDLGHEVLVETGGHRDISVIDPRARVIMDIKCPGSHMSDKMDWQNLGRLWRGCELKFVLANRADYDWALQTIRDKNLDRWPLLFSPVHGDLELRPLAEWMLADRVSARLQVQMHKYIWDAATRGV